MSLTELVELTSELSLELLLLLLLTSLSDELEDVRSGDCEDWELRVEDSPELLSL